MTEITQLPPTPQEGTASPAPQSVWASLFRVFTGPRAVFEALAAKPRYLVPLIVLLVVHMAVGFMVVRSGVTREVTIAQLEERNAPPEQIEATERMMDSPLMLAFGTLGAGLGTAFAVLVGAALLYFMANLMLGAKLTFGHFLCAASYGGVVGLVDAIVRSVLIVTQGNVHVRLGLGAFLGDGTGFPIAFLDTLTGPLFLWSVAIEALGVSVFARKGFGFGALAAIPGLLVGAALAGMGG
jgi:hypothetical protein